VNRGLTKVVIIMERTPELDIATPNESKSPHHLAAVTLLRVS